MNKKKWLTTVEELYQAQLRRKFYEEEEARLKAELAELSNNESAEVNEWKFDKIERKGSIAYSAIPFLKNMDLEEWRRPGTIAWVLKKSITASDLDA